jgi:para-nitrobenzyl esterase
MRFSFHPTILLGLLIAGCGSSETSTGTTTGTGGSGTGSGGAGGGSQAALVVKTDKGAVEGALDGSTRAFLGIPYAAPPTGALRWKAPAPHEAWTETRKATTKGMACAQKGSLTSTFDSTTGEDCLTVNVWTPDAPASAPLPVLVWIHGGGFVIGSGGDASYDGKNLSAKSGFVVVSLNYRLGPLGFLGLPALKGEVADHPSTGGYGLEDQRAALEWVKANIAAFGGDPANVTLFGESAGGASTCMHLVSPKSKGLFQRAIIESGPCDLVNSVTSATTYGDQLAEALGCKAAPDVLACMRGKTVEEIIKAEPANTTIAGETWYPSVDGWNLPDLPSKLVAAGSFEKMPTIFGTNADEGSLFIQLGGPAAMIPDEAAFEKFAEANIPGHGVEIVAHYPTATYGTAQKAATAAITDGTFTCATRRAARAFSKAGAATYLYHFTYVPEDALLDGLGSFHSAEIKYVLGNPGQLQPQPLTADEKVMSAAMMGYWSRHADKGDPNGEGAFAWPKYDATTDEDIVFDLKISKEAGLKKDLCDFWDSIVSKGP